MPIKILARSLACLGLLIGFQIDPALGERGTTIGLKQVSEYLEKNHLREAVWIKELTILQNGRSLSLYDQIGNEEKNKNLNQRPILTPTSNHFLFVRGTEIIVRVDRALNIQIKLRLQVAQRPNQSVIFQEVSQLLLKKINQEDLILLYPKQGIYQVEFPAALVSGECVFTIVSSNERHRLSVFLKNNKIPVTISLPSGMTRTY